MFAPGLCLRVSVMEICVCVLTLAKPLSLRVAEWCTMCANPITFGFSSLVVNYLIYMNNSPFLLLLFIYTHLYPHTPYTQLYIGIFFHISSRIKYFRFRIIYKITWNFLEPSILTGLCSLQVIPWAICLKLKGCLKF